MCWSQRRAQGTFLNDLVMEEILGELRDIGRRGGISCTCGCREWKLKINYSSVELFCAQCGGALKLPAATMSDIEDYVVSRRLPFGAGNRRKMPSEKIKKRSQPGRTSRHLRHKMD